MKKTSPLIVCLLLHNFFIATANGGCSSDLTISVLSCSSSYTTTTLNCNIQCTDNETIEQVIWWWLPCSTTGTMQQELLNQTYNTGLRTMFSANLTVHFSSIMNKYGSLFWCSRNSSTKDSEDRCALGLTKKSCSDGYDNICIEQPSTSSNDHCSVQTTSPTPTTTAESKDIQVAVIYAFLACIFMLCLVIVLMVVLACVFKNWHKSTAQSEVMHVGREGNFSKVEKASFKLQATTDNKSLPLQAHSFSNEITQQYSKQNPYQDFPVLRAESPNCISPHMELGSGTSHSPPAAEAATKPPEHTYLTLEATSGESSSTFYPLNNAVTRNKDSFSETSHSPSAAEANTKVHEHTYFTLEATLGESSSTFHQDNSDVTRTTDLSDNNSHLYFTLERPGDTPVHQQPSVPYTKSANSASTTGGGERQNNYAYSSDSDQSKKCHLDSYDYAEIDDQPPIVQEPSDGSKMKSATIKQQSPRKVPKAVAFIPSQDSALPPVLFCQLDPQASNSYPMPSTVHGSDSESTCVSKNAENPYFVLEQDHDYAVVK